MKTCTRCKQEKGLSAFRYRNKYSGSLLCWCMECEREQKREKYKNEKNRTIKKVNATSSGKARGQTKTNEELLREALNNK